MTVLQVVFPIGGVGKRFTDEGFITPKPLIPVNGIPMIKRAMSTFKDYKGQVRFFPVVREEHEKEFNLGKILQESFPNVSVTILAGDTKGPAETALQAENLLEIDQPLIVMDCDITFSSPNFFKIISRNNNDTAGILLTFKSNQSRYSYVELDSLGYATRTAEKIPISENAIIGAYFFSQAKTFIDSAKELVSMDLTPETPEFYLSTIYNLLISSGKKIRTEKAVFHSFGTPEELRLFEQWENIQTAT